jgi:hypothetical protein
MSEKKRLRKGEAKIQFIACGERIAELRAAGLDIKATYLQLVKENRITMTYTGFYENFSQRQKKRSRKGRAEAAANLQPAVSPSAKLDRPVPAHNLTLQPIKPTHPLPPSGTTLAVNGKATRAMAIQESINIALKKHERFLSETESDPEAEILKKELIG